MFHVQHIEKETSMKEYYLTNKICGLFRSQAEKDRLEELERQRIITKIVNSINFEIERETKELNKRLCGLVSFVVEREISKRDENHDSFC